MDMLKREHLNILAAKVKNKEQSFIYLSVKQIFLVEAIRFFNPITRSYTNNITKKIIMKKN